MIGARNRRTTWQAAASHGPTTWSGQPGPGNHTVGRAAGYANRTPTPATEHQRQQGIDKYRNDHGPRWTLMTVAASPCSCQGGSVDSQGSADAHRRYSARGVVRLLVHLRCVRRWGQRGGAKREAHDGRNSKEHGSHRRPPSVVGPPLAQPAEPPSVGPRAVGPPLNSVSES